MSEPEHDPSVRNLLPPEHDESIQALKDKGNPPGYARWAASQSRHRLMKYQSQGLHWRFRTTVDADGTETGVCICGLILDAANPSPATQPGHLDTDTWEPTDLVIGYASDSMATWVNSWPRYVLVCHRCTTQDVAPTLLSAQRLRDNHTHR